VPVSSQRIDASDAQPVQESLARRAWTSRWRLFAATLALLAPLLPRAADGLGITESLLSQVREAYGRRSESILRDWQELVADNRGKSDDDKLSAVNRFFNRNIRFVDDDRHWRTTDYWATPLETMVTRGGDCEDFVIAKYFTLRELGVPDERMRLTYVRARRPNQAHMVLSYYPRPGAEPLVLDNLTGRILPASRRDDLTPVYSFNGSSLWMAKERGGGRLAGSADNVNKWRMVRERMSRGGLP
jgi:predicted transglutaminase-like cysteine proteinase